MVSLFLFQILAVYDRFGRLIHGHPHVAKDVLEYVVFEKHIVNVYGKWRLHKKIIPQWLQDNRAPSTLTHILLEEDISDTTSAEDTPKDTEEEDEEKSPKVYDRFGKILKKKE